MDTAEFKTKRESMGMTSDWVAAQLGVSLRSAQDYEAVKKGGKNVPPNAERFINHWWEHYKNTVDNVLLDLTEQTMHLGASPRAVELYRYRTDIQCHNDGNAPMSKTMHAALQGWVMAALERSGFTVEILWKPSDEVPA